MCPSKAAHPRPREGGFDAGGGVRALCTGFIDVILRPRCGVVLSVTHHEMVSAGGRVAESRFKVDVGRCSTPQGLSPAGPELLSGGPVASSCTNIHVPAGPQQRVLFPATALLSGGSATASSTTHPHYRLAPLRDGGTDRQVPNCRARGLLWFTGVGYNQQSPAGIGNGGTSREGGGRLE